MQKLSQRRTIFLIMISAFAFTLLACRVQDIVAGAFVTPTRVVTRAALRPTFTPRPQESDTPEASPTPSPTSTEVPTEPAVIPPPPTATRVVVRQATPTPRPTNTQPPPPTSTPQPTQTPPPQPTATPTPVPNYPFTASNPTCTALANATDDKVSGTITAGGQPAVGQRVRGSSGPGGEPISDTDAQSNAQGKYSVTFICGGGPCNGDFWVWMVDAEGRATSRFVKFSFSDSCRRGVVNFTKP